MVYVFECWAKLGLRDVDIHMEQPEQLIAAVVNLKSIVGGFAFNSGYNCLHIRALICASSIRLLA